MQEKSKIWKKIKVIRRLRENFVKKAEILASIREFFAIEGFLEVDTPTLVPSPDPCFFNEVFKIEGENLYLTTSPEFYIKKLLAAGLKNVYQITKAYRNWQENDPLHLSEFTILEWYRDNADYTDLMRDCENLINFTIKNLNNKNKIDTELCGRISLWQKTKNPTLLDIIRYQGMEINLTPPWKKISCKEAFKKYADVNLDEFVNIGYARKVCRQKGYQVNEKDTWEELYHQIFLNEVEPKLPKEQPLILYDYPAPLAALSKIKKSDPKYAERFEFYIGGLELGNGYSELTDWQEQEKRLKADIETRKIKGMKVFDYDHDFVEALKSGIPKTAGIAVGIDRLVMLFTDSSDIHEVTPVGI